MRAAVATLMILGVVAWLAGFVAMLGPEPAVARSVEGARLLVGLVVLTGLSFLLWPGRA